MSLAQLLNERCRPTLLLRAPAEMTYTVSSGTLNSTILYYIIPQLKLRELIEVAA